MILDLERFVREGRPFWDELEERLRRLEEDPAAVAALDEAKRFHYLYQRASSDLARVTTFASEPAIRGRLDNLVGRAYGEIHRQRSESVRWSPWRWFTGTFPRTFRRHAGAFRFAVAVTLAGCAFGAAAVLLDPEAKPVVLPFEHLAGDPAERVAREEQSAGGSVAGHHAEFSGFLMTHNIQVSVFALAAGMAWGLGTLVLIFYNGVVLGAVCADYLAAGQGVFLAGWLLPHGSVEIPAILVAGQAGFVLGRALVGWGDRKPLRRRLGEAGPDLATLVGGVAVLLVWAGLVESFFSQYHEPVLPYGVKIAAGVVEASGLAAFLALAGRERGGKGGAP